MLPLFRFIVNSNQNSSAVNFIGVPFKMVPLCRFSDGPLKMVTQCNGLKDPYNALCCWKGSYYFMIGAATWAAVNEQSDITNERGKYKCSNLAWLGCSPPERGFQLTILLGWYTCSGICTVIAIRATSHKMRLGESHRDPQCRLTLMYTYYIAAYSKLPRSREGWLGFCCNQVEGFSVFHKSSALPNHTFNSSVAALECQVRRVRCRSFPTHEMMPQLIQPTLTKAVAVRLSSRRPWI